MKKLVYVKKRINKQDSYKIDTDYLNYKNRLYFVTYYGSIISIIILFALTILISL